ncbi:MAG: heat-shock protein Hsp20 [Lysobacterales bacterium]|jgi:HSP20 family protein|nr:MAG: heat-shock protein Hsp20 [Xanthomonadales bacterium]
MDLGKLAPWNWFKSESARSAEREGASVPVVFRDPWQGIRELQREMDRVFDQFFRGGLPSAFPSEFGRGFFAPALDIAEDEKGYRIELELPGLESNDVSIELEDGALIVRGEKKLEREEKKDRYHRIERSYGQFQRILDLPDDADAEKISANFKNGVLTISLPKRAGQSEEKRKRIPVQSG